MLIVLTYNNIIIYQVIHIVGKNGQKRRENKTDIGDDKAVSEQILKNDNDDKKPTNKHKKPKYTTTTQFLEGSDSDSEQILKIQKKISSNKHTDIKNRTKKAKKGI